MFHSGKYIYHSNYTTLRILKTYFIFVFTYYCCVFRVHPYTDETLLPSDYSIYSGVSNIDDEIGGVRSSIKTIHRHPQYTTEEFHHDVAVIKLEEELVFNQRIMPICLPDSPVDKQLCKISGWGNLQRK